MQLDVSLAADALHYFLAYHPAVQPPGRGRAAAGRPFPHRPVPHMTLYPPKPPLPLPPHQDVGVQLGDGDGTVPLLSLGLMCRKGWAPGGRLNPAGSPVVTREYKHRTVSMLQDPRWGGGEGGMQRA